MTALRTIASVASIAALVVCLTHRASAQRPDSTARAATDTARGSLACAPSGTTARVWVGGADTTRRAPTGNRPTDATRSAIDTVITLDITDRTWTRDSVTAGVAIGAAGTAGARRSPWLACVGASVGLERVTATLRNVHGQIHFRADPSVLERIGLMSGSTPTPPAGPPRR
jgi:hypothetical protein